LTICDPAGSRTGEAYDISRVRVYSLLPIYIVRPGTQILIQEETDTERTIV